MEKESKNRVLALSLRPRKLDDLIGQNDIKQLIQSQFQSRRIPHFFIISGVVGCGKTTLARILSNMIHLEYNQNNKNFENKENDKNKKQNVKKPHFETREVNAANQTGIDDMRKIIEQMSFKPLPPSQVKIVIMDEAHQLSIPAQNALITETEDVPEHVFYIFCTSSPTKIIPALQRRAFHISPKLLKDKNDIFHLVEKSASFVGFQGALEEFVEAIQMYEIFSPGLIVQAAEKFFSGLSVTESLTNGKNELIGNVDMLLVCRSLVSGKWHACAELLKNATRSDSYCIRASILGYLKSVLLKSKDSKAINVAKAIRYISDAQINDESTSLPSLLASICLACAQINLN